MDREFLDLYNRELHILQEQAREFAQEFPGIAERLGGLLDERTDPMVAGLLEGAAFLAARVQLKLKHEFPEFTGNLLEQLVPNYLAPTPSVMLAKVTPLHADPKFRDGHSIARGSYLDATYRERERQVACRYRLCSSVTLWPLEVTGAEYYVTPGPLQALGVPVGRDVLSGLRISLTHRTTARLEEEPPAAECLTRPETWISGCPITELPIHILGAEADAVALYEQLIADCSAVYVRYLDAFGDPVVMPLPRDCIAQVGFDPEEALLPNDNRLFRGFDFLREYFMFPRKFLAVRLTRLASVFQKLNAKAIDIVFAFGKVTTRLAGAVRPEMFALYAAPAVNLFEKTTDRIPVNYRFHEYHIVPDRSRYLDFEPQRVLAVYAHFAGERDRVLVRPLYSASMQQGSASGGNTMYYTVRRMPRRRTSAERLYGTASDYVGTDIFLSIIDGSSVGEDGGGVVELSLRTLCSNRHLPEHLPVGEGGADFRLLDDVTLDVACIAGPTKPREPVVSQLRSRSETAHVGTVTWRLVNMLSMNHLGLVERGSGRNAAALREVLLMFGDAADSVTERKVCGIRSVDSRPIVRRVRERAGIGAGRGTEVTVTLDEKAFEGSGAFLLGAVLERFFSEYAALNHFTETVIHTTERGELMRWPVRMGARRPL